VNILTFYSELKVNHITSYSAAILQWSNAQRSYSEATRNDLTAQRSCFAVRSSLCVRL